MLAIHHPFSPSTWHPDQPDVGERRSCRCSPSRTCCGDVGRQLAGDGNDDSKLIQVSRLVRCHQLHRDEDCHSRSRPLDLRAVPQATHPGAHRNAPRDLTPIGDNRQAARARDGVRRNKEMPNSVLASIYPARTRVAVRQAHAESSGIGR